MAGKIKHSVILLILFSLFSYAAIPAYASPDNPTEYFNSTVCASSGCPAGQRLNFTVGYGLSLLDPTLTPNVQVCIYTPNDWSVTDLEINLTGGITHETYTNSYSNCEAPPGAPRPYTTLGGASAKLPTTFGDSLNFAFRLGATASSSGTVLVLVLEQNASGWTQTSNIQIPVSVVATNSNVFVGNSNSDCLSNSPCYVNSSDGNLDEIGTGLQDAIDAGASEIKINILGNYLIKGSSVVVDKPDIITGVNNSSISYQGANCSSYMLRLTGGASVTNLKISSGTCSANTPSRILLLVESASLVTIDSNTLTNGQDAIHISSGNTAAVRIQFNNIQNNAGYGIVADSGNKGTLDAVANNIFSNNNGKVQANCNIATQGTVDHNYWGTDVVTDAISNCTYILPKRLGVPIQLNNNAPGVNAQFVTAKENLAYDPVNLQIGFKISGGTTQKMDLYIVNHGAGKPENVPFPGDPNNIPSPCSNFWDIFRADNTPLSDSDVLELHFKYDYINSSCISTIDTTQYCKATNDPNNQLWWYDPITTTWATTGQNPGGQPTTCDSSKNEMVISINSNTTGNHPNFNDLSHLPFVVGLPNDLSYGIASGPTASPGSELVKLSWTTSFENNLSGFNIQRSTSSDPGTFITVSDLIKSQGNITTGQTYNYTDPPDANHPNLINNTTYYYRVQIVGLNGKISTTGIISVTPFPSTSTPTLTPTITFTPRPSSTRTATRTLYPTTIYYYRSPTPTWTVTLTPTSPFQSITPTLPPTLTPVVTETLAATATEIGYPAMTATIDAAAELANARATRTAIVKLSQTPTPKPVAKTPPLSLTAVLAILAGVAAAGGVAIYLLRDRIKLPF